MRRVKKQLVELLSSLSAAEIKRLRSKLVAPKLESLRREKAAIKKRLHQIERQILRLAGRMVRKRRKLHRRTGPRRAKRVRRAKRGTVIAKIKQVLARATSPMRVRDICNALARAGLKRKKGLVNYVNRTLSANPSFAKVGWGLYRIAGQASAPKTKKAARRRTPPETAQK